MRLLQAIKGKDHGGAEGFFDRLAQALMPILPQKLLVPFSKMPLDDRLKALIQRVPFGSPLDLRSRLDFFQAIATWKPDLVLTWMNRATRFCPGPLLRRGLPPFSHVARLGGFYDLKYYQKCDALIGNTRGIVSYLVDQGWPKDRAFYVPNFVSLPAQVSPFSRDSLHVPPEACLLVAAGRLHVNKAFDTLLKAVSLLPHTHLWLLGEGPELSALQTLSKELGIASRVQFLGWHPHPTAYYNAADIFICPSRHEPLGNVLLDAWAHGRPLVAAASQGPTEFIQDGVTGCLSPIDDAPAMAQTIDRVWTRPDLRHQLVQEGTKFLKATFSKEAVVAQYLDTFAHIKTLPPKT